MTATQAINVSELTVHHAEPRREPAAELEAQALSWPQRADAIRIVDQPSYDTAVELLRAAKALRNEAEEHHRPMIDAAYKSHKTTLAALKRVDDPLASAETKIKLKIGAWDTWQEQVRLKAEREAREAAELLAAQQLEAELEAIEAAGGKPEEVAAVIAEAERVPVFAPMAQQTYRPAAGISSRSTWSASVYDMPQLIAWLAHHPQYSSLVKVDQAALNNLARSMQSNLNIPGVRVNKGTTVAVR